MMNHAESLNRDKIKSVENTLQQKLHTGDGLGWAHQQVALN